MKAFIFSLVIALLLTGVDSQRRRIPTETRDPNENPFPGQEPCPDFQTWKRRYRKTYPNAKVEAEKKAIYEKNKEFFDEENRKKDPEDYTRGCNQFADMTLGEFTQTYMDTSFPSKFKCP